MGDSRIRLLVIDDEPAICELVADVAELVGFATTAASSREEIEAAIEGRYDCVVLDLSLGDIDGIEVMSRLGSLHRGMPLILVSGADESLLKSAGTIAEMHRLRVLGRFAKPFSVDLLRAALLELPALVSEAVDPTGPRARIGDDELLDPSHLLLAYQPKVSASTGDVVGVEALVRWRSPFRGDLSPSVFVALVEEAGRSGELLDAVMTMAARDRSRHRSLDSMPNVSLNVSVLDLVDEDLPRLALRILSEAAEPARWTFEITETTPITAQTTAISVLTRLRLAGFHLAVDDFGTGTSNYERLLVAPFTELKIDRAIVARVDPDATEPDPMVRSGIDVGHSLGMQVVAEGVESFVQMRAVRDLGCDSVQGYLVSPPVAPDGLDAALDGWAENFGVSGLAPD